MSSRWAKDSDEDVKANNERKKKREEKRRQREEKQRLVNSRSKLVAEEEQEIERPTKRQRTTSPSQEAVEAAHLLELPNFGFQQSRSLDHYEILNSIEEGSYGYVSRARSKASGDIVALKRLKLDDKSDGFPVTGLREIRTLKACSHPHIVKLREVITSQSE